MSAGSQGGKTSWGPHWLKREIDNRKGGDFLAVTASYDLFRLKMLPAMLAVFEQIYGIGRYWVGDKLIEILDPTTGEFWAKRSSDAMWGRVILRSADALGGLESSTARAAWLDECGQDKFTLSAYKAIRRRLAIERGKMLLTTTLYNLGWLTNNILDPILRSGETRVTNIGDSEVDYTVSDKMDSAAIQFDSIINPRFPHDEFEEQRKLLSQDEFEMFFRGRKSGRKFLIYNSFDYAKHTCDRFDIPDEWPRYVGIDFGGTHMAVIFFAEKPDTRQLYAYREYFSGDKNIFSHVSDITSGERHIERAVGGAQSEAQWRTEFGAHGMYVEEPPIKDVDLGIQRVYSQFKQDNVIIFNDLSEFLDEIGRYRRKRDSSGQVLDDIENKETFHILDAVRYIVGTIRPGVPLRAKIISLGDINIW
jgi:hypothetical protein